MPEKGRMSDKDKNKIAEKMSEFILLMGYNADFQVIITKELNKAMWMNAETLGRKQCRELLYLLYMADCGTLLSFTVSLGKLIWASYLSAKRKFRKKVVFEKLQEARKRRQRRKKDDVKAGKGAGLLRFRVRVRTAVVRREKGRKGSKEGSKKVEFGSRIYRLALAMCFLSFRNVCVTTEWEFWVVCFVKQVFGFWRSVAVGGDLGGEFACMANAFGFDVVSCDMLERLQSCLRCSSTTRYQGLC